jgi:uncharacterized membrane protein
MLGLLLPYMAVVMYCSFRTLEHPAPAWFPYFGLSYMLGTISLVVVFGRKISGSAKWASTNPAQQQGLRLWAGYLILIWSGLFLWGAYQTIEGKLAWRRALPLGAFLVAFIALFSRLLYKDAHSAMKSMTPQEANTTSKD